MSTTNDITRSFSITKSLKFAAKTLMRRFWFLMAVYCFMVYGIGQVAYLFAEWLRDWVWTLLTPLFLGGSTSVFLCLVDDVSPRFLDIFARVRLYWRYLGLILCLSVLFVTAAVFLMLLVKLRVLLLIALPLITVLAVWLFIRFEFSFQCIVDENLGLISAFKRSYELTRGVTLKLFLFYAFTATMAIPIFLLTAVILAAPLTIAYFAMHTQPLMLGVVAFMCSAAPFYGFFNLASTHCYRQLNPTPVDPLYPASINSLHQENRFSQVLNTISNVFVSLVSGTLAVIGFVFALFSWLAIPLVILKWIHVIDWSWQLITAPFWLPLLLQVLLQGILITLGLLGALGSFSTKLERNLEERKARPEIKEAIQVLNEIQAMQPPSDEAFSLVRERIESYLRLQPSEFLKQVKCTPVRELIITCIMNAAADYVESGQFHLYRGFINPMGPGANFVKLFHWGQDELLAMGATNQETVEKSKDAFRQNLQLVG